MPECPNNPGNPGSEPRRRILSICGHSGSGKSTLSVAVAAALGENACRVPTDWYLIGDATGATGGPYRWDWAQLATDFTGIDGRSVETPPFDFALMGRGESGSRKTFILRKLMIVDAMLPCPFADVVVRLDVAADVRRERLRDRDVRWGTSVVDRWDRLEIAAEAGQKLSVDLVLDGRQPLFRLVDTVLAVLSTGSRN